MSRLDSHISYVRSRMVLTRLLWTWSWSLLALAGVCGLVILVGRFVHLYVPHGGIWLLSGLGVAVVLGLVWGVLNRPTDRQVAVSIDEKLALKEKFSTAMYIRQMRDPFAAAAVRDAEKTADSVSLRGRFGVEYPPVAWGALAVMLLVAAIYFWFPQFDVLGRHDSQLKKMAAAHTEVVRSERSVRQALVELDAAPKAVAESESIRIAKQDLTNILKRPITDAAVAQQKAEEALKNLDAVKERIRDQQKYAEAKNEAEAFKNMSAPTDEKGPIAEAQKEIASGNFAAAVEDVKKAVDNFDKMEKKDQDKAAEQMKELAKQMAKQAEDPKVQQQIQQQLKQMGASQQQAQQMAQAMQQAANGDKQAQQQVQQMTKQLAQQQNAKQGGSPQQQRQGAQAMQQAMQQMQQQANGQAQAQQMSQSASQLAQAMQQAAQGQQASKGQQASQGKQGSQGSQPSQQAQGAQGQQGQQPGQQASQAGQGKGGQQSAAQQMAQAGQSMQQQLQQLQAMAKDGQAVQAGQQGQQGQGQNGNQPGQDNGNNGQFGQKQGGQFAKGDPNQQGQGGQGGAAQAAGGQRPDPAAAPYGVKQEVSSSQTDEKGKVLASSFVKAPAEKGTSNVGLSNQILKEEQEATDEVEQDRVPRAAQKAVKEYFETLKRDSK